MNKITVVCHKDHLYGYEAFEGKCLLCEIEKLYAEINQITHQLFDYRAAFMRARDREWAGLTHDEAKQLVERFSSDPLYLLYQNEAKLKEKNT